ncbi:MAG TPA: dockerin type I domain-containing protein, partial [candidate division Zixibacteria bacterium]
DANQDAVIDVGDLVYLINYLYKGGPAPNPPEVGDVNLDSVVDIGDVVFLVNYLYKSGSAPCSG